MLQAKFNAKMNELIKHYQLSDDVFVVGVSGGADSLALAVLAQNWAKKNQKNIIALTVDHQLRPESAQEAAYVHELMTRFKIEHHTLVWEGKKPTKSLEEAARIARYSLMKNWCVQHKVKAILIAHHKLDQAETFLMRLQRGSGIDGLCGMTERSTMMDLTLLRPLLDFDPHMLKDFLLQKELDWVEDPHNQCDDFLRVRIRKILPLLQEKIDLRVERIIDTQKVLQKAKNYFDEVVEKFIQKHTQKWGQAGVCFSVKIFNDLHEELRYRVLSKLVREIGGKDYGARADSVEKLILTLAQKSFKGQTLGGCEIVVFEGKVFIIKELKSSVVLSKKEWDQFVTKNKKLQNLRLPYKLRVVLYQQDLRK